jgi:hypothetical protein
MSENKSAPRTEDTPVRRTRKFVGDDTSWNALKALYRENLEKEGANLERASGALPKHVLEYLRGFSKVYLDLCEEDFRQHSLRGDAKSLFKVSAFGSTKVTSDYDVQLTGPGAATLCEKILKGVQTEMVKNNDLDEWALAYKFDSNIYIAPYALNAGIYKTFPDEEKILTNDKSMYIPKPTAKNGGYRAEIEQISKRIKLQNEEEWSKTDDYFEMIKAGKVLDKAYYIRKQTNDEPIRGEEFWKCLHKVMLHAAEALCTVSAFICVVHIIQGDGENPDLIKKLKDIDAPFRKIAIIENILEYWYHTKKNHTNTSLQELRNDVNLDYHKYIERIFLICQSLDDTTLLSDDLTAIFNNFYDELELGPNNQFQEEPNRRSFTMASFLI